MQAPRDEWETIVGSKILVQRAGEGPPLLYLHGAGGGGVWHPFLAELAKTHSVIAPEHPGYGQSDMPDWLDHIDDLAYFYLEAIEHWGLEDVRVVASSLGGWVALEIALRSIQHLHSLTLLAPAGVRVKGVPRSDTFMWSEEERIRNQYYGASYAEGILAKEQTEADLDRQMKNRYITARLGWSPRMYDPMLQKWLRRIRIPTLLIWGREDRIVPAQYGEFLQAALPNAELVVFDACGHLPAVERTDDFLKEFEKFEQGVRP